MKIRNGFVSNSSSASFIIDKNKLNKHQIYMIENYYEVSKMLNKLIKDHRFYKHDDKDLEQDFNNYGYFDDNWIIKINDDTVEGFTVIDNFDMKQFLRDIDVNDKNIKFSD